MDDVGVTVWGDRLHALDILEEEELPDELGILDRLYGNGGKIQSGRCMFDMVLTASQAYSVSVITSFYESRIVLQALIFTLGIFVFLSLFACQTKYDFTSWMPYLFGALWVLILFGFMTMFFPQSKGMELGYGIAAALIFSAYILVDTQLILRHYHVEEEIAAAISLYLDVLNLFLAILRILNSQQNN